MRIACGLVPVGGDKMHLISANMPSKAVRPYQDTEERSTFGGKTTAPGVSNGSSLLRAPIKDGLVEGVPKGFATQAHNGTPPDPGVELGSSCILYTTMTKAMHGKDGGTRGSDPKCVRLGSVDAFAYA